MFGFSIIDSFEYENVGEILNKFVNGFNPN